MYNNNKFIFRWYKLSLQFFVVPIYKLSTFDNIVVKLSGT